MPLPAVTIDIVEALARPGAPTQTGTWFLIFTGGSGTPAPTLITDPTVVTATYGSTAPVAVVRDRVAAAMREGASRVIAVRAATADAEGYTDALALVDASYGPGQVTIPGDTTAAAHDALVAHAGAYVERIALLDADPAAEASALVAIEEGYAEEVGAPRATLVIGEVTVAAPVDTTRVIPGSVYLAALIARGDARVGHSNHQPIWRHDGGAGQVLSVPAGAATLNYAYTAAEQDALADAGACVFAVVQGTLTCQSFRSLRTSGVYRQLNVARLLAQIYTGLNVSLGEYVGVPIDGSGQLYAAIESALTGYLLPLEGAAALYGVAGSSIEVDVIGQNGPAQVAAGIVRAAVALKVSQAAEQIYLTVNVATPGA